MDFSLEDLEAIGDFIARDSPNFAQVSIALAVDRLENFPRSGRLVPEISQETIREIIFGSLTMPALRVDASVVIVYLVR